MDIVRRKLILVTIGTERVNEPITHNYAYAMDKASQKHEHKRVQKPKISFYGIASAPNY